MAGNIQPTARGNSYYSGASTSALKEKMPRAEYKTDTKTFQPMSKGIEKNIEHMEKVEESVAKVPVPPDYSSQTYLKNVNTKMDFKCNLLKSSNNVVNNFSLRFFS